MRIILVWSFMVILTDKYNAKAAQNFKNYKSNGFELFDWMYDVL